MVLQQQVAPLHHSLACFSANVFLPVLVQSLGQMVSDLARSTQLVACVGALQHRARAGLVGSDFVALGQECNHLQHLLKLLSQFALCRRHSDLVSMGVQNDNCHTLDNVQCTLT